MRLRRRHVARRHATTGLVLGALCTLTGCQGVSEEGDGSPGSARDGSVREVRVPPDLGRAKRCTTVAEGDRSATSGGVVAGPFDSLTKSSRKTGVAKLWVAPGKQARTQEDAVIRVEVAKGPVQGDPAVYVRPAEGLMRVSPAPEHGVEKIYNGTVFVPSAAGTTLRITVTIGDATGCFLTRL